MKSPTPPASANSFPADLPPVSAQIVDEDDEVFTAAVVVEPASANSPGNMRASLANSRRDCSQNSASSTETPKRDRYLDNPWFVIVLLTCVTLFIGFPILWKSRAFSTSSKALLTLLVSLETVLVFWLFIAVMSWSWRQIQESM